ncbi:hypothetical protein SIL08_16130 [Scandinavium sp. V105_16]|uniref:Uncharacterized protein n=1 Tax=Scandinavium lactucae TaxID=3095028 RepID=A0AAJ2S227_9ENTR|nr:MULTISPECIES: hypothetical protein [unclassified Scandinavium]MDX6021805.1 hypothetical protein [Scandinavium sp. V105_16]MDX6032449.1 hypothetical protein [Scandinavium sp. V105_12]
MKSLLVLTLVLLPVLATHAGQITIVNPQEERAENGKTLCTYQNSIYLFTYVTSAQSCPYDKTFNTEDSEE